MSQTYRYLGHVVAAVTQHQGMVLLVDQQAADDAAPTWGLPGGCVEPGEALLVALQREVREETGLTVEGMPRLAFVVQAARERSGAVEEWIAFTFACSVSGVINSHDPDGTVRSAHWVPQDEALQRLEASGWYDPEPLRAWLSGRAPDSMVYSNMDDIRGR